MKKSGKYIIETMKVGRDADWTEWRSWKKSGQWFRAMGPSPF